MQCFDELRSDLVRVDLLGLGDFVERPEIRLELLLLLH